MSDIQIRVDKLLPGGDVAKKRNRLMQLRRLANVNRTADLQRELDEAVARYAAGEDLEVLDIAKRVHAAEQENQAARKMWVVVDAYDHQIRGEAEAIQERSTLPALRLIRDELADLVERVRELDLILDDVHDPSTAIRRGVAEQWRQLEEATDEYNAIRAAQLSVYERIAGVDPADAKATMLYMGLHADALVTSADFRMVRIRAAQISPQTYPEEQAWVRWLRSGPDPVVEARVDGTWLAPDRHRYVRALCTLAAPWVPDWTELEAAAHAASIASSETDGSGDTHSRIAGRTEYARLTGTDLHLDDSNGEDQ